MPDTLSRRSFLTATGAAFLYPPAVHSAELAIFPFGTHVYREPSLPLEQIRADLPLLKRLGFTMIKIQESWSTDEKQEGHIDLSRVEHVVSDARSAGLKVYFGITMEQAPAWLWRKYPDATMVYEDGTPHNDPTQYLLPSDGKPGPCWNHPGAREAGQRFVETVGRQIGKYDNILIWNVWQEIGFWPMRPGHIGLCYCRHSLAAFREWLKTQYETLDALNSKWTTAFGDWAEVEPPRSFTQVPSMLDWRYFMDDLYLSEALRWKADAFRRSDPGKRPILAHMSSPTYGSTQEWRFARTLDVLGSSAYPSWGEPEDPDMTSDERVAGSQSPYEQLWSGVMMKFDYVRSASVNGECWTAELEGGRAPGGVQPGRVPDAGDIRRWTLGCLAAGSRGICFWNHRSEPFWSEASGFGLLDRTGTSTDRAEEAGRIARAIQPHAELFAKGAVPPPPLAIIVSERLWQFVSASGNDVRDQCLASLKGIYKALWREGFPVDFIDADDLRHKAANYKVLLAPAPICLSSTVVSQLRTFVQAGGTLISEACPGRFDEYGFGTAGEMTPSLSELFGAAHESLAAWTVPHTQIASEAARPVRLLSGSGPLAAQSIAAAFYLQTLKPTTGRPILSYRNRVAGTVNSFGKGQAFLIGTFMGKPVLDSDTSPNQSALAALLASAGIQPDRAGPLCIRRRKLGNHSAMFLINPGRQAAAATVPLPAQSVVTDLLRGAVRRQADSVEVRVAPLDIACLVITSSQGRA